MRPYLPGIIVLVASLALGQAAKPPQDAGSTPKPPASQASPGDQKPPSASDLPPNDPAPRSDNGTGDSSTSRDDFGTFSSSRESIIDLRPPKDDLKEHPNSAAAIDRETADEDDGSDVQEMHQWNPMKALKDVEVGDYYFKRKNYKGALERYKDALFYKENDAVATFRLAVCQERMSDPSGALANYTAYLKILPNGPFAEEAKASIERLRATSPEVTSKK